MTALSIAGVPCVVETDSTPFAARIAGRFTAFETAVDAGALRIRVEVVRTKPHGAGAGTFHLAADGLEFSGPGFWGRYDRGTHEGVVRQPASLAILNRFLAAVWSVELGVRTGGLLHAAALMRRGHIFAFFGPSGSGKTTLARRRSAPVLSDEVVAIRAGAERATAFGTPWRGRNLSGELRGMFLLRRTGAPSIRRLGPGQAAQHVLRNLFLPAPDHAFGDAVLHGVQRLVERVPVFELSVVRGRAFWPAIDAALAEDAA